MSKDSEFDLALIDELGLGDDDVVSCGGNIIKYSALMQLVKKWLRESIYSNSWPSPGKNWFTTDAVSIEFLRCTGGGWQKGSIRFRLEIVPEVEPPSPSEPPSPLDDLRSELNLNNE